MSVFASTKYLFSVQEGKENGGITFQQVFVLSKPSFGMTAWPDSLNVFI